MKNLKKNLKLIIGLAISLVFMYLAFSKTDFPKLLDAFSTAHYWYILPGVLIMFISYWLRSYRWRFLLYPVVDVETGPLFSSLLIGYMANSFLPAHLGEVIRAYIIAKDKDVPASTVFGSIVTERIIDILTLVLLMGITIIIFPFPQWVRNSGYMLLVGVVVLSGILVLMKIYREQTRKVAAKLTGMLPESIRAKLIETLDALLDGIVPLKKKNHYAVVTALTALIWVCYVASFQVIFYCFDLVGVYSLPWTASLVLLVITTISVVVPSSPGYVGTYHFLCMSSLAFFNVPEAVSLSYAFIMHGINFFPIIVVGLVLVSFSKFSLKNFYKERG